MAPAKRAVPQVSPFSLSRGILNDYAPAPTFLDTFLPQNIRAEQGVKLVRKRVNSILSCPAAMAKDNNNHLKILSLDKQEC